MTKQFIIIDGYNLLHTVGILDTRVGPKTLERARDRLLGILARHLDGETRKRTTVVFDSREKGLPNQFTSHDVLVEFANAYASADEMIVLLVRKHSAPKQLTVVTSDHQIQRVVLARGAKSIDSDVWLDSLTQSSSSPEREPNSHEVDKPVSGSIEIDIEYWKEQMGIPEFDEESTSAPIPSGRMPAPNSEPEELPEQDAIFPPGYADDLFDDH